MGSTQDETPRGLESRRTCRFAARGKGAEVVPAADAVLDYLAGVENMLAEDAAVEAQSAEERSVRLERAVRAIPGFCRPVERSCGRDLAGFVCHCSVDGSRRSEFCLFWLENRPEEPSAIRPIRSIWKYERVRESL